jgi:NADPH2:quinone reductase
MEIVRQFGADEVINHADGRLRDKVNRLTGGKGADVILDLIGGDVFDECLRCINVLGRIVVMGFTSGRIPVILANLILLKNCSILGVFLGGWTSKDPQGARKLNQELAALGASGALASHISQRFSFGDAREAMLALRSRATTGKIVVNIA